ncbi:MAG: membrane dipeptidase [Clostridia bacterium]|nr:membrane dipeptidase [Clostridia bacterium]
MTFYADLHCDALWRCYDRRSTLDDPKLQLTRNPPFHHLQTYAIYIPDHVEEKYRYFRAVYAYAEELMRRYPEMVLCRSGHEIDAAFAAGKTPYLYGVEGGGFFGKDREQNRKLAQELKEKGIAFLSLCYNHGNLLAGGALREGGLTEWGRDAALRLAEAGIALDLSHLNWESADALLAMPEVSVVATHSNCYTLSPQKRNLTDGQIKALIDREALLGINFYPPFLNRGGEASIRDVLAHIRHVLELGGEEILAFGSDFDGIPETPTDLQTLADLPKLAEALQAEFGAALAEKILYGNVRRWFK